MIYAIGKPFVVRDTNLCSYTGSDGRDFCKVRNPSYINQLHLLIQPLSVQADSGGPLICDNQEVAIVCLNFGCGRTDSPSIWTRATKYKQWINTTIRNSSFKYGSSQWEIFINFCAILLIYLFI